MKIRKKAAKKLAFGALAVTMTAAMCSNTLVSTPFSIANAATAVGNRYTVEYQSQEEQREAGRKLAAEVAAEGMVLLKNTGGILPLSGVKNISVFGKRGQDPVYNGSGSGGNSGITPVTIYASLEAAGFNVNPTLSSMYSRVTSRGNIKTGSSGQSAETIEAPVNETNYNANVTASYDSYSDAAILVIGRGGGEGGDLKRANVDGHSDPTEHSLELNDNEKLLIQHIKAQKKADGSAMFDKIICLINTAAAFEVAPLADDPDIDAILWIGMPGGNGMSAVGQILTGAVNPSGRLPAIWNSNFKQDPTWYNFGNNNQTYGLDNGATAEAYGDSYSGTPYMHVYTSTQNYLGVVSNAEGATSFTTIDYSEGIYMGYRWYETASTIDGYYVDTLPEGESLPKGVTNVMPEGVTDKYYNRFNGVVYPFGYGLSYTSFEWTVGTPSTTTITSNSEVTIPVTVKNTGSVAGKDVVEVYSNPPYTTGGIEKATANLITFAKTDELKPGEEQTLELTFNARELASFDWSDANHNDYKGYELEAGNYIISLGSNSHVSKGTVTLTAGDSYKYDGSTAALNYNDGFGKTAEAVFSQDDKYNTNRDRFMESGSAGMNYVSRSNWALPSTTKANTLAFKTEYLDIILEQIANGGSFDKATDPWYVESVPEGWTQAANTNGRVNGKTAIQLADLAGLDFNDPLWTEFMNQLTYDEMVALYSNGSYSTMALDSVGKPRTTDNDGPTQLGSGNTSWPSEPVQAATFNVELGYKIGKMVGNESILSNRAGWYGPGVNTNRSPFGGRNFEYFSQDGVLAGLFGAAEVKGATDMGVMVYAKHMALNEQESYRYGATGVSTWLSEQALREIYMRPWEYAVKYGNCNAAMNGFSKVGAIHSNNNYMMNHVLMCDEWGFNGIIVTDQYQSSMTNRWTQGTCGPLAVRNGVFPLGSYNSYKVIGGEWDATNNCVRVAESMTITEWELMGNNAYTTNNGVYNPKTYSYSETKVASANQWYWVRNSAQRMLYTVGNSNAMSSLRDYTIMFESNYTGGQTVTLTVKSGETFEIPELTRPGYQFTGWFNDAACTQMATVNIAPTANKTYYAAWAPEEGALTITFNENYYGAPAEKVTVIPYGNTAVGYTPVRTGYTFGGWYTTADCKDGTEVDFSSPVYQNHTLFAKWTRTSVTATFNANNGTIDGERSVTETYKSGETVTFPTATRENYVLAGWRNGTGNNSTYYLNGTTISGNTTYSANWVTSAAITATFNQNYAGAPANTNIALASAGTIRIVSPTRAGYTFAGWNTAADGSGTAFTSNSTRVTENTTYYAIWTKSNVSVSFSANYNGAPSIAAVSDEYGTTLSEFIGESPIRTGYTFYGWYKDVDCTIIADLNSTVTADMQLFARWTINSYTVTYNYNGANIANGTVSVNYTGNPEVPANPVRYGYLFDGWYADAEGTGFAIDVSSATILGDTTYYAKWLYNGAQIKFDYNYDGATVLERFVENGEYLTAPIDPVREGYTFGGWYTDAACTYAADFNLEVVGDTNFYAKWTAVKTEEPVVEEGGCGGNIASTAIVAVAALTAVAAVAVIARKKKEN